MGIVHNATKGTPSRLEPVLSVPSLDANLQMGQLLPMFVPARSVMQAIILLEWLVLGVRWRIVQFVQGMSAHCVNQASIYLELA